MPLLTIIGVCVGLAGGLFGIGGSIVLIPALTEVFGPDQHRYQAAAMCVNFFVAVPALLQHFRARAVDWQVVRWLVPLAVLGVLLGVALSEAPFFSGQGEAWLRLCFSAFLLFAAGADLYRLFCPRPAENLIGDRPQTNIAFTLPGAQVGRRVFAVGLPTGVIAGLLGVGGGIVAVPLQRRILGIPIRRAIGNSTALIIATSIFGAVSKNYAYTYETAGSLDALKLAALVAPGAVIGSLLGSRLTHRLRLGTLKALFIVLLMIAAVRMGWGALGSVF